jgi:hypothetical protein
MANAVKNGIFYYYPINSNESFSIVRNDSVQKETQLGTKDTSYWRISWQNDSVFSARYWKGTRRKSDAEISFYNAHLLVVKIKNITASYYTFSGGIDSVSGIGNTQDTAWFKPKLNGLSN